GDIRRSRQAVRDNGRDDVLQEFAAPRFEIEAEHGRLLIRLTAAAHKCECGPTLQRREDLSELSLQRSDELVVFGRIERRQHAVLPDEYPELVTQIPEVRALICSVAAEAQHVHTGVAEQFK